ncbi:MAG: glycosyltransferase, partial [Planctomycetes bacterium]|nr:glycosyltransferase [Planctomycetota bacterium]
HDGCFIEKYLGVKPDLCPDQGLSPSADEMTPLPEPDPTSAVYIGRVEPDSGIRIYLDAVRRLTTEQGRDFRLHVYGDGSLMPELRDLVARESLPVIFHGWVLDAQRHITDSCFAFIDGRMAIQEAMARRRLVLAAYVNPLKHDYVAGEAFGPYLVPVATGAELAERVAHFIDHPHERAALVEKAYEHARTLTWSRAAETYVSFWQERLACPAPQLSWTARLKLAWHLEREAHRGLDPGHRSFWHRLGDSERASELGLPPRALSETV